MKNLQEEELKNKEIEIATKYQNGEISFESEVNKGTEFKITFKS